MKRILFLFSVSLILSGCSGLFGGNQNVARCTYMGSYWGQWFPPENIAWTGTVSKLTFYSQHRHPSDYSFIITIDGPVSMLPSDEWAHYKGSITYKANTEDYWANTKKSESFVHSLQSYNEDYFTVYRGINTTTRPAEISLMVSRNKLTYNVFFDGVGFGVAIPKK